MGADGWCGAGAWWSPVVDKRGRGLLVVGEAGFDRGGDLALWLHGAAGAQRLVFPPVSAQLPPHALRARRAARLTRRHHEGGSWHIQQSENYRLGFSTSLAPERQVKLMPTQTRLGLTKYHGE